MCLISMWLHFVKINDSRSQMIVTSFQQQFVKQSLNVRERLICAYRTNGNEMSPPFKMTACC